MYDLLFDILYTFHSVSEPVPDQPTAAALVYISPARFRLNSQGGQARVPVQRLTSLRLPDRPLRPTSAVHETHLSHDLERAYSCRSPQIHPDNVRPVHANGDLNKPRHFLKRRENRTSLKLRGLQPLSDLIRPITVSNAIRRQGRRMEARFDKYIVQSGGSRYPISSILV